MSEELFSYGYYEGTTGDLLLVSMRRCARCYCGRGLATCVIIIVTVFNCGRGLACCFQITLEEVLLVVLLIVILLLWQRCSHMCYCYYHSVPVAEVSRHILNRVTPLPTSVTPLQHHLLHPASLYITLHPAPLATSLALALALLTPLATSQPTTSSALCHRHCLDRFLLSLTTEHICIHRIAQKHTDMNKK